MARETSFMPSSCVMPSVYPDSKTAIAFRLPEPMVAKGRLSVDPCGYTCRTIHDVSAAAEGRPARQVTAAQLQSPKPACRVALGDGEVGGAVNA